MLYVYPYLNFDTGSPKAMAQIIDVLDRRLFDPVYGAAGEGPLTRALVERGVEIVPWPLGTASLRRPVASMSAIRRQAQMLKRQRIDLVHANCFPWNTDVLLAAAIIGIPVIVHVHNRMDIAFRNLTRIAARKVLFCSGAVMRECGHVNRVGAKAAVLHNMIDAERWRRPPIRNELGLRDTDIAVGTVAQIVHRKGIDILLDAARILLRERNDLVFLIAGPCATGEEEFARRMLATAQEPAMRGRVRFLGSRADIAEFMASLDLFVLPTRGEPFGIVLLEAMAAGVPVIASNVGGIPEIVTSPEIGRLVEPVTGEAFAAAASEVLSLPDRGKRMAGRAWEELVKRFDVRTGRERVQELYLEALESSR